MGWHMLAKRDAYVRIVLQRCCLLASEWKRTMDGAETTLARLFDIFNSHKLADLPTETEHDFPAFLRDFDAERLSVASAVDGEAMQDPSFHLFVRLLAKAGQEIRDSVTEVKEGDRRISRLFSRMTPIRVMPFTGRTYQRALNDLCFSTTIRSLCCIFTSCLRRRLRDCARFRASCQLSARPTSSARSHAYEP